MSPFPGRINREAVIQTAIELIEAEGVEQLSVNVLAERLGVKTPSLYRYVRNKTDLLRAVNEATFSALFAVLYPALETPGHAQARVMAVAQAYRAFAHQHPVSYGLAYTNTIPELRPDESALEQAALRFQALMAELSGEANSLVALRGLLALIHGFVMLELGGQLRRGGDLSAAFSGSVEAYIRGWAAGQT